MIADTQDRPRTYALLLHEIEAARKVMALGGSLMDAATSLGIGRDELDLALWRKIDRHAGRPAPAGWQ